MRRVVNGVEYIDNRYAVIDEVQVLNNRTKEVKTIGIYRDLGERLELARKGKPPASGKKEEARRRKQMERKRVRDQE